MVSVLLPIRPEVSTHSRPKAAGRRIRTPSPECRRFNTQPPEGGWSLSRKMPSQPASFNTQPPEGGWKDFIDRYVDCIVVSTHSRPKAAGYGFDFSIMFSCCFNTQPPEGGWIQKSRTSANLTCFNTQPPEGGWKRSLIRASTFSRFQHTAARRRLAGQSIRLGFS